MAREARGGRRPVEEGKKGPFPHFPRDPLDPGEKAGLLFAGMGGPDGPEAVGPFLRNLFRDPAVLPLPRPVARVLGAWIARRRTPAVREKYAALGFGGGSPQRAWMEKQCRALERETAHRGLAVTAAPAMRYWHPFPGEAVTALLRAGAGQFVVVPAFPHAAAAVTGSVLSAVLEGIREHAPAAAIHVIPAWHRVPGYVEALCRRAEAVLGPWIEEGRPAGRCACVLSAHALPERFVAAGDPYVDQVEETCRAVRGRLARMLEAARPGAAAWLHGLAGGSGPLLAYQSRVGPVRWTGPGLVETVRRLGRGGCRHLLVLPVSFTCEHIETLGELDMELAAEARAAGVETFARAPALNLDEGWLRGLAACVAEQAFGRSAGRGGPAAGEVSRG